MSEATIFRIQQENCDGVSVFPSLGQLADHMERSIPQGALPFGDRTLDLESIQLQIGGRTDTTAIGSHYDFYYDPDRVGTGGDGSERDPWPDLLWGLRDLDQRLSQARLVLEPGARLTIHRRHMFIAGPLERRKRRTETTVRCILMAISYALALPLVAILGYLTYRAWPALNWEFLTQNPKNGMTDGGIWAPLIGTFFLVLISLMIAAPIGILAGVYLNEYAKNNWWNRLINLAVVNLAGVPSIVHALFGVGAFVLASGMGESLLAASCTLAVMTLPVIIASTREALASVPMSFREACWNMGATRWQTVRTIVLPNAISGILTGVILQVARAAGETAPILFTGAAFFKPIPDEGWGAFFPYRLGDRVMALSMHLYTLRTQVPLPKSKEHIEFGTAIVLIGLVLVVNSVSIGLRVYLRNRRKW